jgi:ATP-dependent DNA helicase DinG
MESQIETPLNCFPLRTVRSSQTIALQFLWDSMIEGYEDIVISAPTGIGKTGIGAALCLWAGCLDVYGKKPGGYYLVTQKMLQDQLERDFPSFLPAFFNRAASLKSAHEYPCKTYGTCGMGTRMKDEKACGLRRGFNKTCPQLIQKQRFEMSDLAVTNYPYMFTEHMYVGKLLPRVALVADECHTLEKQITSFVEVCVNRETLNDWAPHLQPVRQMPDMEDFTDWLTERYIPSLEDRQRMLTDNVVASNYQNKRMMDDLNKLENHIGRTKMAVIAMQEQPEEWVYWQEVVKDDLQSIAKPISAVPFFPDLIQEMASTRLYMSAYPGPKDVFCRSLGLNQKKVAWLDLDSTFPVEHRPIHIWNIGSMGRANIDQNFPALCKVVNIVLEAHKEHKGIIHCHSYQLGSKLNHFLASTEHRNRILFPLKAADRRYVLDKHRTSKEPTIILSPSIAEGFSFDDDLARFQIVAKVPYPYLGDKQVQARKSQDPEWYVLQTVMTILQACGRIVRSDTDYGDTYVLDSDFIRLYEENGKFFPKWFRESFQFLK